ncbi:EcsC family protein [Ruixingdingia sedimenti]|uniref:EcsC family protein n=1 Tax=Ruixingdingia sedimenti TaxID=3073604 RepID=A0ABU1FB71_9RHOB|nr:EcsC family protein [Xinfangfangia sp. LG-4]MDR5654136.1 EcsC family protein [Xinfangfangia sp. LG-4]
MPPHTYVQGMDNDAPVPALRPSEPPAEIIAAIAARHHRAGRGVMAVVNRLGTSFEDRLQALPEGWRNRLDGATEAALLRAYGLARAGGRVPTIGGRGHVALASISGALGGLGGLPSALAELPVAVTLILHQIQEVADHYGFDPAADPTRRETLQVFGAGSPLADDDGANSAFIGARLTFTGPALNRMIATIAPRLATALGPKLAAQAVPVLGAAAGAGLNAAYMGYYREMAHVRFGLLRLALDHDPLAVQDAFRRAVAPGRIAR